MNEQNSPRPAFRKKPSYLPENREKAIEQLRIRMRAKYPAKPVDETPFFLLYLNYAVNNIVEITRIDPGVFSPDAVAENIRNSGKQAALANFLWLFGVDNPKDEFPSPECLERAVLIAKKIYELRNFFTHLNEPGNEALLLDRGLYVLLEGEIGSLARSECMEKAGVRSDKLNKLKLVAPHNDEKTCWELTRKGIIFLTCMALYKDDAMEFCNLFHDMKLAPTPKELARQIASIPGADAKEQMPVDLEDLPNQARAKALHAFFTMFSMRKGRELDILAENFSFTCFADIIGYLNKVPAICHDYLSLDNETKRLQTLADASTESDENKLFKYKLHRRFRDRFLTFAAGYCEDFDIFPSIRFKRLDITPVSDRKRYLFGKEQDNRLRMERHYAIVKDAIRFEWLPQKHYGPIHIGSLRSSISATQMKQLLALSFRKDANLVNDEIERYFAAYHLILEKMLNAADCTDLYLDSDPELMQAFVTVTGASEDELLSENFSDIAAPFFPANLTRFFLDSDNRLSVREMQAELYNKLAVSVDHAKDFIARLDALADWRKQRNDEEDKLKSAPGTQEQADSAQKKHPMPVCSKDDVLYPPRHCKFSDADLCAWFFRYINLFLTNDRKFRQLPKSKQHRGDADFEYQYIQSLVGKFNLDQKGLWLVLEKRRPELNDRIAALRANISRQLKQAPAPKNPRGPGKGRPSATLTMLARAAADEYARFCKLEMKKYDEEDPSMDADALRRECRRFGIRPGMEKDRDALFKTILRLDPAKWGNAFDYENKGKRSAPRQLSSVEHIVSQIPFPNLLPQRFAAPCLAQTRNLLEADGTFDFNKYLRTLKTRVTLRDYYDVAPLVAYAHTHDRKNPDLADDAPGIRHDCFTARFSATAINKAVAAIKDVRNQDSLLCRIAFEYWEQYKKEKGAIEFSGTFDNADGAFSVYEVFSVPVRISFGKKKLQLVCNDINRTILTQISKHFATIAKHMDDPDADAFEFYRMVEKYREIQAADRQKRLDLIKLALEFDAAAPISSSRYAGLNKEQKRAMELAEYSRVFPGFSADEYGILAEARNKVFHDGLDLDVDAALDILRKYLRK